MRKALNENPLVQVAVVGLLIVVVGLVFMMNMGGGGGGDAPEPSASSTPSTATTGSASPTTATTPSAATTAAPTPVASRPLGPEPPADVRRAYDRGDTVVLLVVNPRGIEDREVRRSLESLRGEPGVSVFVVPSAQIADYSHLTQGLQVSRVPALVVVRPKRLSGETPVAQVHYGFRSDASIKQAVEDAEYEGQPASYGPE